MKRATFLAFALVASCGVTTVSVPPLGISTVETVPSETAAPSSPLTIARVATCDIPPYYANDASGPFVIDDVVYGDDSAQRYDIAFPTTGKPKALVVIVHGGGWTSGGRKLFRPTIRSFASVGYVAASVSYRLASSDSRAYPADLSDVRCAIRAASAQAGVGKTIVLGASAGAHLAAMAALTRNAPGLDGDCSDHRPLHVDGAILYYAPLAIDRARERYIPIMRQAVDELLYGVRRVACARSAAPKACAGPDGIVDEDAGDWMARARAATPSRFVTPDAPPMLIVAGTEDNIVPIADAREFDADLARAGVPHLLVEVPGQKHGFPVLGRAHPLEEASCTVLRFLSQIASR